MKTKSLLSSFLLAVLLMLPLVALAADKPVSDDLIYDLVRQKLAGDQVVKGGALEVEVKGGVVTLGGQVQSEKQKDKAERLAHKVKGVKSVVNQIKVVKSP
jgi:hyperosmotically inducible periplasmic protein